MLVERGKGGIKADKGGGDAASARGDNDRKGEIGDWQEEDDTEGEHEIGEPGDGGVD